MRKSIATIAFALLLIFHHVAAAVAQNVSEEEAAAIAKDAYVYAYPLVLTYLTAIQTTNFAEPTGIPTQAPFNQFSHGIRLVPADYKVVVRPNNDTLYSTAVVDVGSEPIVLSVPATERYFMLPMMSLWSDIFAVPGSRTTGRNTARDFLLVGPNWRGTAPAGLDVIRSPTRFFDIVGRTQINGTSAAEYDAVNKVQFSYKLVPLSAWGKGEYTPPKGKVDPAIDMKTSVPVQIDKMDASAFFGLFSSLLNDNPPGPFDYPILHRLERLGFKVGKHFDLKTAPSVIQQAFARGMTDGNALVLAEGKKATGVGKTGWVYTLASGAYGADYLYRAAIAQCCLGENLPQDAVYPSLATDSEGRQLDGSNSYVMRFEKGKLPPVDAFWSVTAYDKDGYFIPNALNRQALGDRSNLVSNQDGSVELLLQSMSPGKDKEANWLPVTAGQPFNLLLRLYSSREPILTGEWVPPPVKRVP